MNTHTHRICPKDPGARVWTTDSHNDRGDRYTVNWRASDATPLAPQFDNIERQQSCMILAKLLAHKEIPQ